MRQIINGRVYDTETATQVASYWNGLSDSDFNSFSDYLYKKKTGEFFLYGYGGPMSKYARSNGNTTSGSKMIRPYTEDQAKAWVERYANEEYETIFGKVEE